MNSQKLKILVQGKLNIVDANTSEIKRVVLLKDILEVEDNGLSLSSVYQNYVRENILSKDDNVPEVATEDETDKLKVSILLDLDTDFNLLEDGISGYKKIQDFLNPVENKNSDVETSSTEEEETSN